MDVLAQSHYERSDHHPTGLVKQAYSAFVTGPDGRARKWHLTAYFTYADLPGIPTVDADPLLRSITVPQGVYRSSKARSRNSDASSPSSGASAMPSPPSSPGPGPSRPSSPLHHGHSARHGGVVLPSLHSAIASTPMGFGGHASRAVPRIAEDQRMIQMLNARPI